MAKIEELTQEDVDRMEAALDKYKKENEKFRTQRDEYKAAAESNEVNAKLRERVLKAEAQAKLAATGVKDADRFAKYIDFSKVGIDENDAITGLDDQIESIKTDFADIFDPKKRVGGMADAGDKNPVTPKPADPTSAQLDALFGSR
jgi:hypothetical protein